MDETILQRFSIDKITKSEELGGTLHEMTHRKTGAQLVWLDNGQENKVFSIAFKTVPWDDTGVFHILEHSVLCGSEKFPVKEPFVELLKSSMQTYLNALTYPDKTIYPVSSRNTQDFLNLVNVYLDSVFFPALHRQKNIFLQEGWHYELADEQAEPAYKGVVHSEMKGACGTVDAIMDNELCRLLYPDSCYGFISGGDPTSIPKLSYEAAAQTHRDFYHPSNARIYLDGNVPLEQLLDLIDSYLCQFDRRTDLPQIPVQAPIASTAKHVFYEIGKEEPNENRAHLILGKQFCSWQDRKQILAFDILASYLTGSNAAPLKAAILDSGLAQDVYMYCNDGMAQPYFALCIRNTEQAHIPALQKIIRDTVEGLLETGLDTDELAANLDQLEYMLLEAEEPKGILRAITVLSTWLYGGEPLQALECREILQQLRQDIGSSYYAYLLRALLWEEAGQALVCLLPSRELGQQQRQAEQEALRAAKNSWTQTQQAAIWKENQALIQWQAAPDSPESLQTLPRLSLADISPMPEKIHSQVSHRDGAALLFHPIATRGTVHLRLYFAVSDVPLDSFCDLSFLCDLLGELPTSRYSSIQLQQNIKRYIGHLRFAPVCYAMPGQPQLCKPYVCVSISLLERNLVPGLELVAEILKNTRFDDPQLVQQILLQACEDLSESIQDRGEQYASLRSLMNHSAAIALREKLDGCSMLWHLEEMDEHFDARFPAYARFAQDICSKIFTPQRLTLSQTGQKEHPAADILLPQLGSGSPAPEYMELNLTDENLKEAIVIPAAISYTACGENLTHFAESFDGRLQVLSGLLSYSYLWNEIRVKGGAYGCAFGAGDSGNLTFTSHQDPDPKESLEVYGRTAAFIESFCQGPETLEKYIISTLSAFDPLCSAAKQGAIADSGYFTGLDYEARCARRQQLLGLQKEELLSLVPLFEKLAEKRSLCLVCPEDVAEALDSSWNVHHL